MTLRTRIPAKIGGQFVTRGGMWRFRVPTLIVTQVVYDDRDLALPRPERDEAVQWCYDHVGGSGDWRIMAYRDERGIEHGVFYFNDEAKAKLFEDRYGIKPPAIAPTPDPRVPRRRPSRRKPPGRVSPARINSQV